jgi:hypothetical protein
VNQCRFAIQIVLADGRRAANWRKRRLRDVAVFRAAHGQAIACLYVLRWRCKTQSARRRRHDVPITTADTCAPNGAGRRGRRQADCKPSRD